MAAAVSAKSGNIQPTKTPKNSAIKIAIVNLDCFKTLSFFIFLGNKFSFMTQYFLLNYTIKKNYNQQNTFLPISRILSLKEKYG